MPWTINDVEEHKKGLTPEQKKKWVSIANGVLKSCQAEGGEDCDAKAIQIANSKVGGTMKITNIKAIGDWELDVLAAPFGDVSNKDSDGEFFTPMTKFYLDKVRPLPVWYHGYSEDGKPMGDPETLGETKEITVKQDGVWLRIALDKASEYAQKVWEAAKQGLARASSGTAPHLRRINEVTGEIRHWPMFEISLFNLTDKMMPANQYAIATPVLKMMYNIAELESLEVEGEGEQQSPNTSVEKSDNKTLTRSIEMDNENEVKGVTLDEIKKVVAESIPDVSAIVKAEFDARKSAEDAVKAREDEIAEIKKQAKDEATKAAEEELKARLRLPNLEFPTVLKYADSKFDNMDAGEQALMVAILQEKNKPISDVALKSLAAKLESDKTEVGSYGRQAMKSAGIKADEVNYSTYATYGDEWVGVAYSNSLWERIRMESNVIQKLAPYSVEVPQGMESIVIPLESTDPIFYKMAQATAIDSTLKVPAATVANSPIQTGNQTLTLSKLGGRTIFTGEMEEDSLIPWMPQLMKQLQYSGQDYLESAVIDGDNNATSVQNINDIAGTPAATDWFMLFDGFRVVPLVTNSANSRSAAGSLGVEDYLETVKLLGTSGRNALDRNRVSLIIDPNVHWKTLALPEVETRDVFSAATVEGGQVRGLWGYDIIVNGNMCKASATQKSNTAGKIDQDTTGNNLYGSILAVRWDQWRLGWKRRMKIETNRIANADVTEIVAQMRVGLTYRDTEASAITYYVGV